MANVSKHKILYVSGVTKTRESMTKICRFLSYDIKLVSTCDELATADTDSDLVIIGTDIAGRCDQQFIEWVQQQFPKPILVCLTNAESEELLTRSESLDDVYYLVVPCSPVELKSLIKARLGSFKNFAAQSLSLISRNTESSLLQTGIHVVCQDLDNLALLQTEEIERGADEQAVLLDHIQRLSTIMSGVDELEGITRSTSLLSRSEIETLLYRASERAVAFGLDCEIECLSELPDRGSPRGRGAFILLALLLDMSLESTSSGRISFQIAFNRQTLQLQVTLSDTGESVYSARQSFFEERYPNFFRIHQLRRSIVEELASQNEATLCFSSLPGVGNQIELHVPVSLSKDVAFGGFAAFRTVADRIAASSDKKLVVVGCARDTATHLVLSRMLAENASQVLLLQSHKATIQMAVSAVPRTILLGLDHPGLNAVKLARQVRQSGFQGEIVALSLNQGVVRTHVSPEVFTSIIQDRATLRSYLKEVVNGSQHHSVTRTQNTILQDRVANEHDVPGQIQVATEDLLQRELISSFLSELSQKLPLIRHLVMQRENYDRAAELTNQLAGAALMASLADLGDIFMALEISLEELRTEDALVTINKVEEVCNELVSKSNSPATQGSLQVSETILSELSLDSQELRHLVLSFAGSLPDVITQLRDALELHDWDQLRGLCHEYAGASSLYGYSSLSDELKILESYVSEKDYVPAHNKLTQIIDISRRIVSGIGLAETTHPRN